MKRDKIQDTGIILENMNTLWYFRTLTLTKCWQKTKSGLHTAIYNSLVIVEDSFSNDNSHSRLTISLISKQPILRGIPSVT